MSAFQSWKRVEVEVVSVLLEQVAQSFSLIVPPGAVGRTSSCGLDS